jgi:hypothetical protein
MPFANDMADENIPLTIKGKITTFKFTLFKWSEIYIYVYYCNLLMALRNLNEK